MGEAKRRKARSPNAVSDEQLIALMKDIELPLPTAMGNEIDLPSARFAYTLAGGVRLGVKEMMRAALADDPGRLINNLLGALQFVLKETEEGDAPFVAGLDIACERGCAWCCRQNVEASIAECILVAVETGAPGDPRGARIDAAAAVASGLDDLARVKSGASCPFLDDRGTCSVYDIRPFACRGFYSPDAKRCEAAHLAVENGGVDIDVLSYSGPQLAACARRAGINGASKDLGLQHDDVEFLSTIAAIRKNPELIDRWASGEKVFAERVASGDRPLARLTPS